MWSPWLYRRHLLGVQSQCSLFTVLVEDREGMEESNIIPSLGPGEPEWMVVTLTENWAVGAEVGTYLVRKAGCPVIILHLR